MRLPYILLDLAGRVRECHPLAAEQSAPLKFCGRNDVLALPITYIEANALAEISAEADRE